MKGNMTHEIQTKLDLFVENTQTIKKDFKWHNFITKRLASLLYALEERPIDCAAIRDSHNLIKNSTGVFSAFRGNMALAVAALLSLGNDRKTRLSDTLTVYELLKMQKLHRSEFLSVAAYQIAAHGNRDGYPQTAGRTRAFYDGMKAHHFLLTGRDDYIFAAMLGLSDIDVTDGTKRIEQIYQCLKPEFWASNSVQTLAQILTLGGETDQVSSRVLALRNTLRANNLRMDKVYTLPSLGVLALLPVEDDTISRELAEAKNYLRAQKGFGAFSIDTQQLLLCAASVIASVYAKEMKDNLLTASLATSITNIIIAQEAAMIAAISASSAAAANASN